MKLARNGILGAALMALLSCGLLAAGTPKDTEAPALKDNVKTGILLMAFGTTDDKGREAYAKFEKAVKERFPGVPVAWGYTAPRVRAILEKRGIRLPSPDEALESFAKTGVEQVAVQSLHIFQGEEFDIVTDAIEKFKAAHADAKLKFAAGRPLLFRATDLEKVVAGLPGYCPKERTKDDAVVLFGHGNAKGYGDFVYLAADAALNKADPLAFATTVEGRPSIDETIARLKEAKAKKVYLIPLMFVAGDHVKNDMAGDSDDSLKSLLKKEGMEAVPVLQGFGETACATAIYLEHLEEALKAVSQEGKAK